ncbi:uncharacterized protein [Melanerpes formicivorus]|uniref:uncharacterized protein isoform X2 n=1 Tax=Melanerpes formicivorus TaxID=211600 RepID=UPI00358EF9AF
MQCSSVYEHLALLFTQMLYLLNLLSSSVPYTAVYHNQFVDGPHGRIRSSFSSAQPNHHRQLLGRLLLGGSMCRRLKVICRHSPSLKNMNVAVKETGHLCASAVPCEADKRMSVPSSQSYQRPSVNRCSYPENGNSAHLYSDPTHVLQKQAADAQRAWGLQLKLQFPLPMESKADPVQCSAASTHLIL